MSSSVVACHECDLLQQIPPLQEGSTAYCPRCGAPLRHQPRGGLEATLALFLTALALFWVANAFPILELNWGGRSGQATLFSSVTAVYRAGMVGMALMVLLPSLLFPLLAMGAALWLLLPLHWGRQPWQGVRVLRGLLLLLPLGMVGVYLLGVLVAMAKLMEMATVVTGPAFYALLALVVVAEAARGALEPAQLWERLELRP